MISISRSSPEFYRWCATIALFVASFSANGKDYFGIVDYAPSRFIEESQAPFFYSIGKQLKYGTSIDVTSSTVFEVKPIQAELDTVLPSPDGNKALVVSDDMLYLVQIGRPTIRLLDRVGHYSSKNVLAGTLVFLWTSIRWSQDSQHFYIVKDLRRERAEEQVTLRTEQAGIPSGLWTSSHYQKPLTARRPPPKVVLPESDKAYDTSATMYRFDIGNPEAGVRVISGVRFGSFHYFQVGADDICFRSPLATGALGWFCTSPNGVSAVQDSGTEGIHLANGHSLTGSRFASSEVHKHAGSEKWFSHYGYAWKELPENTVGLFSRDSPVTPLISIKTGISFKGDRVSGVYDYQGAVLPGGRYVLLSVDHDRFTGQLLVDGSTGQYRELPKETVVYRSMNSDSFPDIVFNREAKKGRLDFEFGYRRQ